jgi:Tol biopolymer transport system component
LRFRSLIPALALLVGHGAGAQYQTRSWLPWRTVESGRFAIHFTAELESWARNVAAKTPHIDSAVSRAVGYRPPGRIDIVIDDPFRIANGSSWPLLDAPRIVMWATPPDPREDIGTFVSWADMLTTHEFAHLAHLLRPTRNSFQDWLWKLAPVELGPISVKAPRWVIEGYATYIEGVVTGSGRPNGVWRPTILRQWAIEGALPRYEQLNSTSGMYGGEFAYLAGSSFLEWLVQRRGDSSLVALWRRMSARRDRGFAESFAGVYGEAPDILYGRFAAELTAAAKARQLQMRGDTGTTIQHLARETGDPAISRDGGRAAIRLASATRPGRIVIWRTIPEPDTMAARADRRLLASDPQDVAPYRPFPGPKKALATLQAVGNQSYQDPRFFSDGRVLVWRNTAIGDGSWKPDLYVWDPQRGSVRRITRRGNVQQGDPSPAGDRIAATQCGSGKCDLVLVDPVTGKVQVIAAGSDVRSFYRPRYSHGGRTIAVAVHDGGFWRAGLFDVADTSLRIITTDDRNYFDVAFADDSTLVASSDEGGLLNIVKLRTDGRVVGRITSVSGAAVAPEPNAADGSVWFLSLHARGWDVRSSRGEVVATAAPAPTTPMQPFPLQPLPPTRRYSPDRKWVWFPGGSLVGDGGSVLLGLANTDPVGKLELLIQAAKSVNPRSLNAGMQGASLAITQRSITPLTLSMFAVKQDGPFWYDLRGGSLSMEMAARHERWSIRVVEGGTWSRAKSPGADEPPGAIRRLLYLDDAFSASRFREGRRTTASLSYHADEGRLGRSRIARYIATGTVSSTEMPIAFTAQRGLSETDALTEQFTLGGNPPTMLPTGVLSQYIAQPALPPFFTGKHLETYRLSVPFGGARLYGWAGRVYNAAAPPFERILGAEWSGSLVAIPVLGTPAARATIGVGRWMNRRDALRQNPIPAAPVFVAPSGKIQFYITTQFGDWSR